MDPIFWAIVAIPLVISLGLRFFARWEISWVELGAQMVGGVLVLALMWAMGAMAKTHDREVWNGAVTAKRVEYMTCPTNTSNPCKNGYDCNCYTVCTPTYDSKGNMTGQSCTTYCDRCYRYPWEQNWLVHSNLSRRPYEISRVDAQGAVEPPRYTQTRVGDPVSVTKPFENWVKAASNTLFRDSASAAEKYVEILPPYPINIYDYYKVDRVLTPNVRLANRSIWDRELARRLATLGPSKEVNAIFVFVEASSDYAPALRYHWEGFNKNDAVVVIGLKNGNVDWVDVMSWSKASIFDVRLRNALMEFQGQPVTSLNPVAVMDTFATITRESFVRRPMEEFEYLRGDIQPPAWFIWLAVIFALLYGVGTSVLFKNVDLYSAVMNRINGVTPRNRYYPFN